MTPDWIAVDWGTTNLRAFAMAADGAVLAEAASDDGMGALARDGFEPALLALIAPWLAAGPVPVLACGMVGARQGWVEAATGASVFNPEIYYLTHLPARLNPGEVAQVMAMALGLSLLATLYPSWRAARTDPVDALRHE